MESVFHKKLVDSGLAVSANAGTGSQPDIFQIMVQMAEGKKSDAALKVIDQEMANLMKKPIDKDSFVRAVNQDKLNLYGDISNNSSLGSWLGEYVVLCNDYMRGFEILQKLNTLKPADLTKVAKTYLTPSRRSVVVMKPAARGGKK
jgi:zinc protease